MSDSKDAVPVKCTRYGPYRQGSVIENGAEIITLSQDIFELRYPNGTRTINHLKRRATQFIQSDGTEAIPGEFIELEEGQRLQVPRVFWPPYTILFALITLQKRITSGNKH